MTSCEVAEMLHISRQTLYNYLHTGNPRVPRPINAGAYKRGEKRRKLVWIREDVITHIRFLSSNAAYVGTVWSYEGWKPTVTYHGGRWDGGPAGSAHSAFAEAWIHFERLRAHSA